ncbi:hypothetical protein [Azonexus sp.]|uniref:hypothetical protein n=1 Tax=Azonexus sp. TaxID=1872668 RepID=UPI0035B223BB
MRIPTLLALSAALALSACATQEAAPAKPAAAAPAPAAVAAAPAAPAAKAPQCWNGDTGAFMDLGAHATISGVEVVCQKTSDGKNAQWMGAKAKH